MDNPLVKSIAELAKQRWCIVDWNGYLMNLKAHIEQSGKTWWEHYGVTFEALQSGGFLEGNIYTVVVPYDSGLHRKGYCIIFFLPEGIGIAEAGKPENYAYMDTPAEVIERCRELLRSNRDMTTPEYRAKYMKEKQS